jgi:AbiV family abortive infection protein
LRKKRSQEETTAEREVCLAHAHEVVGAARILRDAGFHHLAYHLGTLALEETGKSELLSISALDEADDEEAFGPGGLDDHVRKLFFALWGPSFGKELITKESLEMYDHLATNIHRTRLEAIYYSPGSTLSPRHAVTPDEANTLVSMAEARVEMARAFRLRDDLGEAEKADIKWYSRATKDPDTRRRILGRESMKKLVDLGSASAWIHWLRSQFEAADAQALADLKSEMARTMPEGDDADKPKWRVRILLETNTHSIRPRALTWWNDLKTPIRFYPHGVRKRDVTLEFTLPGSVPIAAVWTAGWDFARQVVFALNVGSLGYFWWYTPLHVSKYYETITDLERNVEVNVQRSPALMFEDRRVALSQDDLTRVSIVLATLWRQSRDVAMRYVGPYTRGITFLSKNDIHLQLEPNAFLEFFNAFTEAHETFFKRAVTSDSAAFSEAAVAVVPAFDDGEQLFAFAQALQNRPGDTAPVTLEEVGKMKALCDGLILMEFRRQVNQWRDERGAPEEPS